MPDLIKIGARKSQGITLLQGGNGRARRDSNVAFERLVGMQRLEPERRVRGIVLGGPVIGHIPGSPRHDSISWTTGRLPSSGNVVTRGGARLLPMQRIRDGLAPAVKKLEVGSRSGLLLLRPLRLIGRSILRTHENRREQHREEYSDQACAAFSHIAISF